MSSFATPLDLRYLDGHNWQVLQPFDYACDILGRVIVIPRDFITDFASIPKILWNILPPTGSYGKAAVVHDWLYRTPYQASRKQADDVFLEAMTCLKVGWFTRRTMYVGVRVGGASSYKGRQETPVLVDATGHQLTADLNYIPFM